MVIYRIALFLLLCINEVTLLFSLTLIENAYVFLRNRKYLYLCLCLNTSIVLIYTRSGQPEAREITRKNYLGQKITFIYISLTDQNLQNQSRCVNRYRYR